LNGSYWVDGVIEDFKYWLSSTTARAVTAFAQTFVGYSRKQAQHNSDALHTARVLGESQLQQLIDHSNSSRRRQSDSRCEVWVEADPVTYQNVHGLAENFNLMNFNLVDGGKVTKVRFSPSATLYAYWWYAHGCIVTTCDCNRLGA
jgi:hypothetical protein